MKYTIGAVHIGRVKHFRGDDELSAIDKLAVSGPVRVDYLGLEGDEQADLVHHGGRDKAIHHYPLDHYDYWRSEIGDHPALKSAGAFGENISTTGLIEDQICIGDRFSLGTAIIEVSQGRQPCWKLGHRFGNPRVTALVVSSTLSGWYYRVLDPGIVSRGDELVLLERRWPEWTVQRVFQLLIGGKGSRDRSSLDAMQELSVLAESWKGRLAGLLNG